MKEEKEGSWILRNTEIRNKLKEKIRKSKKQNKNNEVSQGRSSLLYLISQHRIS
jgi:hypothetical protein